LTAYNVISPGALTAGQPEDVSVILSNFNAIAAVINGGIDASNLSPSANIPLSRLAGFPSNAQLYARGDGTWATPGGDAGPGQGIVPSGVITPYVANTPPSNWLMCDGSQVSRTTYAALFGVISTVYGAGDGTTTFNVPDLKGRIPIGKGSQANVNALAGNDGLGEGSRTPYHGHTHNLSLLDHYHSVNEPIHGHGVSDPGHVHYPVTEAGGTPNPNDWHVARNYDTNLQQVGYPTSLAYTGIGIQANVTGLQVLNVSVNAGGAIPGTIGYQGAFPSNVVPYLVLNYIIKA